MTIEKENLLVHVLLDVGALVHHVPHDSVLHFVFDLFILDQSLHTSAVL